MDDTFLTVTQLAKHLQLNPQTVRNWLEGAIPR
jgi:DNA-binding transcriptional regulator YhcF (GntR family)